MVFFTEANRIALSQWKMFRLLRLWEKRRREDKISTDSGARRPFGLASLFHFLFGRLSLTSMIEPPSLETAIPLSVCAYITLADLKNFLLKTGQLKAQSESI